MIYFKDQFATVWKVEDKGNYSLVRMSTARKNKEDGSYKNSNWSFVRFVKDAHSKVASMEPKTRIVLKAGGFTLEPYEKDGEKKYPKNPQMVVFDIELSKPKESDDVQDTGPEEDLPF